VESLPGYKEAHTDKKDSTSESGFLNIELFYFKLYFDTKGVCGSSFRVRM